MKFFSLESSKKLAELGCVSKSNHFWSVFKEPLCEGDGASARFWPEYPFKAKTPAFTTPDFLSSEEYAIENCRKLWGDGDEAIDEYGTLINLECRYDCGCNPILSGDILHFNRHAMLDAPDQITFVEEYLK